MFLKVEYRRNYLMISVDHDAPIAYVEAWNELMRRVLRVFLNRRIDLVSVDQNFNSLGEELKNLEIHPRTSGTWVQSKWNILLNRDVSLNEKTLELIYDSDLFCRGNHGRGQLRLVLSGDPLLVMDRTYDEEVVGAEMIEFDNDGDCFVWHNPPDGPEKAAVLELCRAAAPLFS